MKEAKKGEDVRQKGGLWGDEGDGGEKGERWA